MYITHSRKNEKIKKAQTLKYLRPLIHVYDTFCGLLCTVQTIANKQMRKKNLNKFNLK